MRQSLYEVPVKTIDGKDATLNEHRGEVRLVHHFIKTLTIGSSESRSSSIGSERGDRSSRRCPGECAA